jgi:glyoxylase-like metal-dependent hydrolase (beta-lactamase superfamily II)
VVGVPGHTPGSAALHLAGHDAVLVGDALVTWSWSTGETGPRLSPFNADRALARDSLRRLEGLAARSVLPGHGAAFPGGVDEAVRLALVASPPG